MTLHRPLLRLACLVHVLAAGSAWAQSSPYYLGVSQSLGYESNLYRLGDNQVLPEGLSRSDNVSGTSLVAGVDQTIGRQRVYGSANLRANRFSRNKSLDNDSYSVSLALDSETVNNLSSTLSLIADQNLAQFNSRNTVGVLETNKNIQRTLQLDAKLRLGLVGRYSLEGSVNHRQRAYSAAEYDASEFRQNSASLGLRWRPSGNLSLGAALRDTQATYPRFRQVAPGVFEGDRLSRQDIDLTASWQPTGLSQLGARISPTHSRYQRGTSNNFSGLTGSASWVWQATGKLKLTTQATRDTGQSSDAVNLGIFGNAVSDYGRTSTTLSTRGAFDFSAKIGLTAGLIHTRRALVNTFVVQGLDPVQRSGVDTTSTLALGARWLPTRAIQTGCDFTAERRTASNLQLSVPLSGHGVSCYGQFILQ